MPSRTQIRQPVRLHGQARGSGAALQGSGEAVMKKSPGALARRPSNSHRRTISSSGAPACRRQRST